MRTLNCIGNGCFMFLLITLLSASLKGQQMSCDDLIDILESEGYNEGTVNTSLVNSSWLKSANAYEYDGRLFVIAEIKSNEFNWSAKEYVFCDVPERNWNSFKNGYLNIGSTPGERFHEYIFEYKCNCY
jgi:hypothetical protein